MVKKVDYTGWTGGYVGNGAGAVRDLTDFAGKKIGTCRLASSWKVNSYIGSRMYQIYATVNGVKYTGRGFGTGMSVNLRPVKKGNRK